VGKYALLVKAISVLHGCFAKLEVYFLTVVTGGATMDGFCTILLEFAARFSVEHITSATST
jgi:hypothetical protein